MDLNEYLPMFLAESREHLQELNLAVVRVEENPNDAETIGVIFRIAHSLKGSSATMGFAKIAALTHEMEDVFELLRQRTGGLATDAIDVLLECLDALSEAFDGIDTTGEEVLEAAPLIERLKGLARDRTPEQALEAAGGGPEPDELFVLALGRRTLHVKVELREDALMPAVRAYMTLAAVAEHGEVIGSLPAEEAVEQFTGKMIEIWLATEHEEDAIQATLLGVPDVGAVTMVEENPVVAAEKAEVAIQSTTGQPKKTAGTTTVRVDSERLDQLMHLMGELVVHRTQVESLASQVDVAGMPQAMQDLTRSSQALQAMVMQVRMIPVEAVFLRFPRLVRDLSAKLDKKVELNLTGVETELDRTVVDALGDPMVHLVRNSLDHGLESVEERVAAGKPPVGTLEISARHAGGSVLISVKDDGRGIDPKRVAAKAAERGLIPPEAVASVDMARAVELLFTNGFSTAETTSDVSGRGVGMDAVQSTVRELGGDVLIESELGKGTTAHIRLPLTLAIVAALLVESGDLPFAIQLDRVERTLRLEDYPVRSVAGKRMLVLRDGVLPILDLAGSLGYDETQRTATHAVVVRGLDQRLVLAVEHLVGQRELVTRPLPQEVGARTGLSGGAVLADGHIALIVDCDALTAAARGEAAVVAAVA